MDKERGRITNIRKGKKKGKNKVRIVTGKI